MTGWCI